MNLTIKMKMKLLLLVLAALAAINSYGQNRGVAYVDTLAVLDAMRPQPGMTVYVRGATNVNDWGDRPLPFTYSSTSSNATDRFCRATATGVGRWLYEWDGNVTAFGAVPYQPKYTLAPWGYKENESAIGTNDFTVWVRAEFPTAYTQPVGLFEISPVQATNYTTATLSSFGMRASAENWGFVFRSTTGSSGAGVDTNGAAVLDSTPSAISAYAGQTVNVVVTRSGTNAVVYFNGTNVTSLFTFSNPDGWSKSLAQGNDLMVQVGNNVNPWYWPKPILRFGLATSAVTAGQAASPEGVTWDRINYTPEDTTEPADLTAKFNAARAYAESLGGGKIIIPPGCYRIDGPVLGGQRIDWEGSGTSPYPSVFNEATRPSATTLVAWFGATNAMFKWDRTQGSELSLRLSSLTTLNGRVSSTYMRSKISNLTLAGPMANSTEGILLDRVGSVEISNVSFFQIPNHEVRAYACNAVKVLNCDAAAGRSFCFIGCADLKAVGNFVDSPKGPALIWMANLSGILNNTFEVAQNPRATTPAYESPTSVDPATDTFTVTNYYGHRLITGMIIRFDAGSGTLPTPIAETNDYFVIVTGKNTFQVSTTYANQDDGTGAFYGNAVVDVTSTGSTGTNIWYSGSFPSFNIFMKGDHNIVKGNHGQQGYDGGLKLIGNGLPGNIIEGNSFILSGYGNPNTNAVAGIVLENATYNIIANNLVDDRDNSAYSQNGIILDSGSLYNYGSGNSFNVDNPVISAVPHRNTILSGDYVHFSSGNVLMSDGVTGSNTNTYYAVRANNASTVRVHANSGTLSVTNNGTGQKLLEVDGTFSAPIAEFQVNSAVSGQKSSVRVTRNYSTNNFTFGAPPTYEPIGAYEFSGYTSATQDVVGAQIITYTGGATWNATNANTQLHIDLTPPTKASMVTGLLLQFGTATDKDQSPLALSSTDGTNWRTASGAGAFRIRYHTNDSGGVGYRTLIVPNK